MASRGGNPDSSEPLADLRRRIQRLHITAGEPSARDIASRTGRAISHTTVLGVIRCARLPTWGQLEVVVEALRGDVESFRSSWVAVRDAQAGYVTEESPSDQASEPNGFAYGPLQGVPDHVPRLEKIAAMRADKAPILAAAIRPNARLLATGDGNGRIRLWMPVSGEPLPWPGQSENGPIVALTFSPRGTMLASACTDGTVTLWSVTQTVQTGTPLLGHEGIVRALTFPTWRDRLYAAGDDGRVHVWNIERAKAEHQSFPAHDQAIKCLAAQPTTEIYATADEHTIRVWQVDRYESAADQLLSTLEWPSDEIESIALSPVGSTAIAGLRSGHIVIWDWTDGSTGVGPISGHEGFVTSITCHPSGQVFATAGGDGALRWWQASGEPVGDTLHPHGRSAITLVSFHPSGRFFVSCDSQGTAHFWRQPPKKSARVSGSEPIVTIVDRFLDDLGPLGDGVGRRIPTGYADLDLLLNTGLSAGELVLLTGPPAMGKSVVALDVLRSAAIRNGHASLLITYEMTREDVLVRVAAAEARVPTHVLRSGTLTDHDWLRLSHRMQEMSTAPLFVNDAVSPSVGPIADEIDRAVTENGIRFVVVDGIQYLGFDNDTLSWDERATRIGRELKALAIRHRIPIVIVAPMRIEGEAGRFPDIGDVRNAVGFDDVADVVIILHRDDYYDKESPRAGEADLILAKHRGGPTEIITVAAQYHFSRLVDIAL
jgi:WD40 repeat protein